MIRFVAVAEELSFSRAARRLNVDQPWLSRQIQKLESELGFELFRRTTRKVELTPNGLVLLDQAREIAATVDRTLDIAKALGRSDKAVLRVGVQPVNFWAPVQQQLLDLFRTRHPRTQLEIIANYTPDLCAKIERRLLDVAIMPTGPDGPPPDLDGLRIDRQPLRLLIPDDHPLAKKAVVQLEDLAGSQIVTFDPRISPRSHEARFGPLIRAGALPVYSPEGVLGLYHMAKTRRLILPAFEWPEADKMLTPGFVHATTGPGFPVVDHWLVKRRDSESRVVQWLWTLAQELITTHAAAKTTAYDPA